MIDVPPVRPPRFHGDCVLIENNIYASEEKRLLDFAKVCPVDVVAQRALRNHHRNVALKVLCADDGGVECRAGAECTNFVKTDLVFGTTAYPEVSLVRLG